MMSSEDEKPEAHQHTRWDDGSSQKQPEEKAAPGAKPPEQAQAAQANDSHEASRKSEEERERLLSRVAWLQAELENTRKRASREQEQFREYALADTAKSLVPVLDSFEQALRFIGDAEKFRSGVELIYQQLMDALRKIGVEEISAEGEPFDPVYQHAAAITETSDAEHNQVLEVLQRGYKLKDRLLRPALVRVAHTPEKGNVMPEKNRAA